MYYIIGLECIRLWVIIMAESVDVVFINSNYEGFKLGEVWEPLGLGILQAVLESKGISTYLIDAYRDDLPIDSIVAEIGTRNPQVVGISAVDYTLTQALSVSRELKDRGYIVNLGGYGPTSQYERCLEDGMCDFVIKGEGEITTSQIIPELLKGNIGIIKKSRGVCYEEKDGIIVNPDQKPVINLDDLPFPLRRDIPPKKYGEEGLHAATIVSSRGCYYGQCGFCGIQKYPYGRIHRRRSPENIIEEMRTLNEEYGVSVFGDMSPCFLGTEKDEIKKLFNGMKKTLDEPLVKFETRADTLLRFGDLIEENLDIICGIDIGTENFSDLWLKRNVKGLTAEDNIKAIKTLQEFEKSKKENILWPFFKYFTIDCDTETTIHEFEEHYGTIKKLEIADRWSPAYMQYMPWTSKEKEDAIWEEKANPFALTLKYMIDSGIFETPGDAFNNGRLGERVSKITDVFDSFLSGIRKTEDVF